MTEARSAPQGSPTRLDPREWLARRKARAATEDVSGSEKVSAAVSHTINPAVEDQAADGSDLSEPGSRDLASMSPPSRKHMMALDMSNRPAGAAPSTAEPEWEVEPDNPEAGQVLSRQLAAISRGGDSPDPPTHEENFALIRSIAPRGGIQSMMAIHLVSQHNAIVRMSALLSSVEGARLDRLIDAISKLSRSYSAGVEALMRHQARTPKQAGAWVLNVVIEGEETAAGRSAANGSLKK